MEQLPIAVIQMGDPPADVSAQTGGQLEWYRAALGDIGPVVVIHPWRGEALPDPALLAGAIITGSWSMVTDREAWSELTAAWLRQAFDARLPLLGICYGHQLLAHALGGEVDYHPAGVERGQRVVHLNAAARHDPLLGSYPDHFDVFLSHAQTIIRLPAGAQALAKTDHDPHQIVRYAPWALSVQFHPEFTPQIMAATFPEGASSAQMHGTPCARRLMQQVVGAMR